MRVAGTVLALLATTLAPGLAAAQDQPTGDAAAGRKVALRVCQVCHGINGIAKRPDAANLAGQDPGYIFRQLAAFRSGERKNDTMGPVSHMLSEQQMRDVAAFYGDIKIAVTSVPGQ